MHVNVHACLPERESEKVCVSKRIGKSVSGKMGSSVRVRAGNVCASVFVRF